MKTVQSENNHLKESIYIGAGVAIIAIAGGLSIPIQPVPVVLQNLMVLIIGGLYGGRLAFITLSAFLILGSLGLPIFSGYSGGLQTFWGPTGGFLLCYPIAATIAGFGITKTSNIYRDFIIVITALASLFVGGVPWLKYILNIEWGEALAICSPYLIPGFFKAVIATFVIRNQKERFRSSLSIP